MTDRLASSTAVLVCQARAVADGRLGAGRFSDPVAERLLDTGERGVVERVRAGRDTGGSWGVGEELLLHASRTVVPRTVAIDDAVREAGTTQVVVLGAGLDTRAWRMTELAASRVFEVDHAASGADKRRRLAGLPPLAGQVRSVAVDLATDPLDDALLTAGFDPGVATTWLWEGVVPYLTLEAVVATVRQVAALSAPGSRFVVQYQAKSLVAGTMRRVARVVHRVAGAPDPLAGEPWHTLLRPDELARLLDASGFRVRSDRSLLELSEGLGLPEGSAGSLRNGRVAVADRA